MSRASRRGAGEACFAGGRFGTLSEMLATRGRDNAGSIAIAAPGRVPLTYRGLALQAEEVRRALRQWGIGRTGRVAIVLPNGPEMAVAFLTVAAAAAAAPVNPAFRTDEYEAQLSRLGVQAMIVMAGADTPARQAADSLRLRVVELACWDGPAGTFALSQAPPGKPSPEEPACPSDVALLLDTSGTTGIPKSVAITQANLLAMARANQTAFSLSETDRCLNVMPLFHSTGLIGVVLASAASGGAVVCAPGFYAPEFLDWVKEYRPTWYTAVPTIHQGILTRSRSSGREAPAGALRFVRSSSSRLPHSVLADLEELFKAPVVESYGLTETGMITCNPLPPGRRKTGSVGVSWGVELEIREDAGGRAPAGRPGEIVVRGPAVAGGYDRNPEATRGSYEGGWFRTGDQGYLDEDGYLFLTGRLKEMINRGGEKISPWEIEAALLEHPAVAEAAAFAVAHSSLSEEVAAAVVLRRKDGATERQLREFLLPRLADFKIPRWIRIVEEIPKNPLGKVQRSGLAERLAISPAEPLVGIEAAFISPRTREETVLAEIWKSVLRVDRVGILDDFFQLGGDSILATRILSQVRTAFDVELSTMTFFETSTLEEMATAIEAALRGDSERATPAIAPIPRR